ncbi:hypothetical protein [Brevibacterium oceani]|uniref:hypothetical protein n=1 Tax=Brevibacterium oceani TaxID=358099 RepID=UPI0015E6B7F7|nr:hypothetical protein [Brevibacterium oceani]
MELVSTAIAAISLIVSIYAIRIAKKEPARARVRANRDIVRAGLREVRKSLDSASSRLRAGEPLGAVADSIPAAIEILDEYQPRLPDPELRPISAQLQLVRIPWRSVERAERRIEQCKTFIRDFEELVGLVDESGSGGQVIRRYQDEIDTESRVREAGVAELREETKKLSSLIDGYVGKLDASDREGA